jgi:hypothetical protein
MRRGHFCQSLLCPKQFVSVAENSGPAKPTHFIDDFSGMGAAERQITTLHY